MITAHEIEAKSREFEIHAANVQRDYVLGWLLCGVFTVSALKNQLFLKGGNALRKGYFEQTRFSADLDFGIPGDVDPTFLLNEINAVCEFVKERAGVTFLFSDNRVDEKFVASETPVAGLRVFEARVYFKDFYGNAEHIRIKIVMDITRFDRVLLPLQTVSLIHPYSDAAELACTISCMKLEEIIATKIKCLLQRQHAPDLFDYAHSIKVLGGDLNKTEVVSALVRKTIFERNPHVLKRTLQRIPLDYAREGWNKSLVCAKHILFKAEEAIDSLLSGLESLFSIYPDNGYSQFAFVAPEWRIPIMEAGRSQTLLKLRYRGADRIVEPYALKYLERRDGGQREYFFGYNRSGGNNPPGMRSFVGDGIESVDNTSEKFEPQFLIELSKAGDWPENPYLFDPDKPLRAARYRKPRSRTVRRTVSSYGPKYVYQCVSCGKQFTKSTNNGILRAHKNPNGYACGSRHGFYVTMEH